MSIRLMPVRVASMRALDGLRPERAAHTSLILAPATVARLVLILAVCLADAAGIAQAEGTVHWTLAREMARVTVDAPAGAEVLFDVIVNLEPAAASLGTLGAGEGKARIRSAQRAVQGRMRAPAAARVHRHYENIPAFSARLTRNEIERLATDAGVAVIESRPVHYKLGLEAHPLIGVDLAREDGYLGAGVVVAVIDDGIFSDNAAFGGHVGFPTPKIIGGVDLADFDEDPRADCGTQSHGSAVAGILLGDDEDLRGVAPQARMVFVKIQSASSCGTDLLDGDLVAAIDWIVSNKEALAIDLIAMSLGRGAFDSPGACAQDNTALRDVTTAAVAAGLGLFAASGNEGRCDSMSSPACLQPVVSVGAVYDATVGDNGVQGYCADANWCAPTQAVPFSSCSSGLAAFEDTAPDIVAAYSNSAAFLDVLAPAHCARTVGRDGVIDGCFGGTSAATPYAAGVGALVLDAAGGSGSIAPGEMRVLLRENGAPIEDPKTGIVTARVDALASLAALDTGAMPQLDYEHRAIIVAQPNADRWRTVRFKRAFTNPVVVVGPPSFHGAQPVTVRVRNVTGSGFEVQLDEWDHQDGYHRAEKLSYLAVEAGRGRIGDLTVEAGIATVGTDDRHASFGQAFAGVPVVVGQVTTVNGAAAVASRLFDVEAGGFGYRIQEQEAPRSPGHKDEKLHYVALEQGMTLAKGQSVRVVRTGIIVNERFTPFVFDEPVSSPQLLADMQTRFGPNPAVLRHRRLRSQGVDIKVEEEQSRDDEMMHRREAVGYVLFGD